MEPSAAESISRDAYDRRQRLLLVFAWVATLLPLAAFGYLTWQSVLLEARVKEEQGKLEALKASKSSVEVKLDAAQKKLTELQQKRTSLEATLSKLEQEVELQRNSVTRYRNLAGIRIQFYRESDRDVVEKALTKLGFKIDSNLGHSRLIEGKPNTIAFGSEVAEGDLRDIAVALVEAEFPLKRIAEAQRQPNPKLIQIYASVESDAKCGLLRVEQIRAGLKCGAKGRE